MPDELAISPERASRIERATPFESTKLEERAMEEDESNNFAERAIVHESTNALMRAIHYASTKIKERANVTESTKGHERAIDHVSTKLIVRAKPFESAKGDERATD